MPKKPMTVTDAYNKAKNKSKPINREAVTKTGMGSGNKTNITAVGAARNAVTKTGMGSGNKGPKKNKSFLDRVGDIGKTVGRVGYAIAKDSVNTVTNPFGAAKDTVKQIGKDVKNKNYAGLGLTAASMIPIPEGKLIKGLGEVKTLAQLAEDAAKGGSKAATAASTIKAAKAAAKLAEKDAAKAAKTAKALVAPTSVTKVSSAQAELKAAREELTAFKAKNGNGFKDATGYKQLNNKITAKEQKVANAVKAEATPPRPQRGVTQKTMTDGPVKPGDAQRTYSGVGRSKTPRTGVTQSPKPNKGQYEGDLLRGQARNDAANMSNRGLRGSSRATRDGRTAENKAKNIQNIAIRENDRKVAKYNAMLAKAKASKNPKDIAAAKNYAKFWKLKGIKKPK